MSTLYTDAIQPNLESRVAIPGHIIQVVQDVDITRAQISSTSYTPVHASQTITPSSASSKILIHLNFGVNDNTTSDIASYITIYRDGTTNLGDSNYGLAKMRATTTRLETMQSIMYLDSPSTTSQITYAMYAKVSGGTFEFPGATGMPTTLTLMEIAQ
jgi:hypothetical protein